VIDHSKVKPRGLHFIKYAFGAPNDPTGWVIGFRNTTPSPHWTTAQCGYIQDDVVTAIGPEVIGWRDETEAALKQAITALTRAKQFIENGVEFGYIDPLKPGSPESQTPGVISQAIAAATKALGRCG